jgi:hypothetical protein
MYVTDQLRGKRALAAGTAKHEQERGHRLTAATPRVLRVQCKQNEEAGLNFVKY